MRHDDRTALGQLRDHVDEVLHHAAGRERADLDADRLLALALSRLLEIIGEAASRTSPECRARHPQLPWSAMIGLRNRLIHGYDSVDLDIVWEVLSRDLPAVRSALVDVLRQEGID